LDIQAGVFSTWLHPGYTVIHSVGNGGATLVPVQIEKAHHATQLLLQPLLVSAGIPTGL
jgi:hypothetical protein